MNEDMLVLAETLMRAEVEAGIKRAISQLPKQPPNFDGCCVDCGEELEPPRLSFGAITCVPCQTLLERSMRQP